MQCIFILQLVCEPLETVAIKNPVSVKVWLVSVKVWLIALNKFLDFMEATNMGGYFPS